MSDLRPEDVLIGLIALATMPWILWILRRGMSQGWLPIGRGRVRRDERRGPFVVLFAFYVGAALLMGFIGLDLLFGIW